MESEKDAQKADGADQPPSRPIISLAQIKAVRPEKPIESSLEVHCHKLQFKYEAASREHRTSGNSEAADVFGLLASACSFYFKGKDKAEPFGPMWVMDGKRSLIPTDFRGEQSAVFAELVPSIKNPALRARLSDTAWLCDRSRVTCGQAAITSYVESVRLVLDGRATFSDEKYDAFSYPVIELLHRALQIGRAMGFDRPEVEEAKKLLRELRKMALSENRLDALVRVSKLEIEQRTGDLKEIGLDVEACTSSANVENPLLEQEAWAAAAEAYNAAKDADAGRRCSLKAAESFVSLANLSTNALQKTHWLESAISALGKIRGTAERRAALRAELARAQLGVADELGSFSHEVDITDLVKEATEAVDGLSFMQALKKFVAFMKPASRDSLKQAAMKLAEEAPLSAMIDASVLNQKGQTIARGSGLKLQGEEDDRALRYQISKQLEMRRGLTVSGLIEPARRIIAAKYGPIARDFYAIVLSSPFVPPKHQEIFAAGFAAMFARDYVTAVHLLTPQLENSLRYLLSQAGKEATSLDSEMIEEVQGISRLLGSKELNKMMSDALVLDIEDVFDYSAGGNVRHRIAHGLFDDSTLWSADVIYGCWLIFILCCLPLLQHWDEIERRQTQIV